MPRELNLACRKDKHFIPKIIPANKRPQMSYLEKLSHSGVWKHSDLEETAYG
jgi:hypothetical protein